MQQSKALALVLSLTLGLASLPTYAAGNGAAAVQVQQIRNATARISYGGKTFLLDPFLAEKASIQALRVPSTASCAIR